MLLSPTFLPADSSHIMGWWYEFKELDKVCWHYRREKGIEKFPRKGFFKAEIHQVKPQTLKDLNEVVSNWWTPWMKLRTGDQSGTHAKGRALLQDAGWPLQVPAPEIQ